ncbi:MAG: ABC transporter ATP-binding protein [Thermoanaerobaculia bacterium]|nr:ABC transporter ATP-binding protein [Thermoanaerobaculia bacterium]
MTGSTSSRDATPHPVIELDHLEVAFGRLRVLRGLTTTLQGRCIGLLGPNGAGKTTLLHTLLGFYKPTAGTARILGLDIHKDAMAVRQLLGYMPERDAFVAGYSAVRFVRLMAELAGLPKDQAIERAHEALFYVGLGEARYRPLESYSLGMKQLAKLAQALVHAPRLLLLDEPTAGLDPPARERMLRLIKELRDRGDVRVVLSSHLLRDVEECCDEVVVLRGGEIMVSSDLEAERCKTGRLLEIEPYGEGSGAFTAALQSRGCEIVTTPQKRLKVVLSDGVEVRDLYRLADVHQVQLRRLLEKRDSLEDIFLKAMERPAAAPQDQERPAAAAEEVGHGGV